MLTPTNGAKSSSSYLTEKRFWTSTLKNQVTFSRRKASSPSSNQLPPNNSAQKLWTKVNISGCSSLFITSPKSRTISTTEKKSGDKSWTICSTRSFWIEITENRNFWKLGWITCFIYRIWLLRRILSVLNRPSRKTSGRFNKKKRSFSLMILTIVRHFKRCHNRILLLIKR